MGKTIRAKKSWSDEDFNDYSENRKNVRDRRNQRKNKIAERESYITESNHTKD